MRTARHYWVIAAVLLASIITALATTAAAPASADAAVACPAIYPRPAYCDGNDGPALAGVNYTGWVYLELNHCPRGVVCRMYYRESAGAWSWTGNRWVQSSIKGGWVYVSPYTGTWRWAWTRQSGWVAITGERFEKR